MIRRLLSLLSFWSLSLVLFLCSTTLARELDETLQPVIASHRGQVAVAIKHLETGESFYHQADKPMPTASLIKFPVMVEAYRQASEGLVDLQEGLVLRDADRVPGSGVLTDHFSAGTRVTLRDAIRLMIVFSDNTATNLVLDKIGLASTNEEMVRLGLLHTKIHAKVFRRDTSLFPERSREFGLGSTTARETVQLYELLHRQKLVSAESCQKMLDHLLRCDDSGKLARDLPAGTRLAHKGGSVSRARCDAGILFSPRGPIAICVMTSENQDRRFSPENAAHRLCGKVAKLAFDHFNPTGTASPDAAKTLQVGAMGQLVEDVQRTLNARLAEPSQISVDGAFGPMTRATVVRFQRKSGIATSGEVDAATWAALGTLVTSDKPVPAPEEVNAQKLSTSAPDDLSGQPYVTCKAWAIADGNTSELLWGSDEHKRLDFASTTKIMTAYVVLNLAASEPTVLDEEVVFSERADKTFGSTAGIRAGEHLPVRETLYGLLLPSGNDASVALAEHFGGRFASLERSQNGSDADDPLTRFISQMNRAANSLGMTRTNYRNTHGLTAPDHRSTAADLIKLAFACRQDEIFRKYVSTRQYGYTVSGPGGYRRNVAWKNTNRLLGIEGYDGIKTGTTSAAGACLVSSAERSGDRLLVVVLGSESSSARYADSRNLYRWAWNQRAAQVGIGR
jgi:D-alanyl-D-alanine carboxypeptidase (penicillin-binding protein 5/6)